VAEIVHVVLIDWAEDAPDDVVQRVEAAVDANLRGLPGVLTLDRGGSVSPEGLESGFDWALVIRFADEQALADYLPHPDHVVVGSMLQRSSSRLVVFDIASVSPPAAR
jgi:hypothetical protein